MKLTATQTQVLAICANHDKVRGSNRTDRDAPTVSVAVAERLTDLGLLHRTAWNGRTHMYALTLTGAAATGAGNIPARKA